MIHQGLFLADGPSDLPLARHLERLCADRGVRVTITPVDPRLLPNGDKSVAGRLRFLVGEGSRPHLAFVHRDSENQQPTARWTEIHDGARSGGLTCPVVPVIPVRMTEAWLLLDEAAIRQVAGVPGG